MTTTAFGFDGTVTRILHDHGSHVEPPLNQEWPDLDKLRWKAAVASHDVNIAVRVSEGQFFVKRWGRYVKQHGYFTVTVGGSHAGPKTFDEAWDYINGVVAGAQAAQGWVW